MKKVLTSALAGVILLAGALVAPEAHAAIRVPKTTWPVCGDSSGTYCVEGVTITTARGVTIPLTWAPNGTAVPLPAKTTEFAPVIEIDKASNKVVGTGWWTDLGFRQIMTDPNLTFMDITSLINTASYPQHGANYDPATKVFDLTQPVDMWKQPCGMVINGEKVTGVMTDCVKSAVALVASNKVVGIWQWQTATEAANTIKWQTSRLRIDGAALASQNLQPVVGSLYNAATKTFAATEALKIPSWVKDQALIYNWTVVGMSTMTPDTSTSVAAPVEAGRALAGRWTTSNWQALGLGNLGYDGLFIDAKTANEFVNHVFVDTLPTLTDSSNKVTLAGQAGNNKYAANLDSDITISIRLRTGEIKPGVTIGIGTDVTADFKQNGSYSSLVVTGNPVTVPLAAKSSDCSGETGIAKANVRQFQTILFLNNDGQSAFGAEGTSGDMIVSSNGVCDLSTPVWSAENKEFSWTAAAPHFAADGTTQNMGFYKAIIPAADAALLWGLTNPNDAVKALSVQVTTNEAGSSAALATIGVKNGKIIIDVSGFGYSRPKLKIALKKSWKPATTMLNKTTITCVMGKSVKKITAVKPSCPKGYKKK